MNKTPWPLYLGQLYILTLITINYFQSQTAFIYNSQIEAKEKCIKWVNEGFKYSYEKALQTRLYEGDKINRKAKMKTFTKNNRYCVHESSTNQYLGYEEIGVEKGGFYEENVYKNMEIHKEIKKYFRF